MVEQRSAEWFDLRCGKVTASRIADVIAYRKDGSPAKAREDYMAEIIAEQLTGDIAEHYVNKAMEWGIEMEPDARSRYELAKDVFVEELGFAQHPTIEQAGASPDGLVGEDGLVEIKCPNTSTHIKTLIRRTADPQYIPQMQWQMACTGRQWCDFASYDPRLPDGIQLFVARIERDDEYIANLETEVREFLAEAASVIRDIYRAAGEEIAT